MDVNITTHVSPAAMKKAIESVRERTEQLGADYNAGTRRFEQQRDEVEVGTAKSQ